MECQQCFICLDQELYASWQAIAGQEGLRSDGDVARFFVTFYLSVKEADREKLGVCCVHCQSPLSLYCPSCHLPPPPYPSLPSSSSLSSSAALSPLLSSLSTTLSSPASTQSSMFSSTLSSSSSVQLLSSASTQSTLSSASSVPLLLSATTQSSMFSTTLSSSSSALLLSSASTLSSSQSLMQTSIPALPSFDLYNSTQPHITSDTTTGVLPPYPATNTTLQQPQTDTVCGDDDDGDGDDYDDNDTDDLNVVKTESPIRKCDQESDSSAPLANFGSTPSICVKHSRSGKGVKRKLDTASNQNKKGRPAKLCSIKTTRSKRYVTNCVGLGNCEEVDENGKDFEEGTSSVKRNLSKNNTEENLTDYTLKRRNTKCKKRKPCASHDLEEGRVIPVEERQLAQVHVYDNNYFERYKTEDDPIRRCGRRKTKPVREKKVPRQKLTRICVRAKHTENNNRTSVLANDTENSDDIEERNSRSNSPCLTAGQIKAEDLTHPVDIKTSVPASQSGHFEQNVLHSCRDENEDDKQSLRILVSAQKILPLRTKDGNYARFLYSFFECAFCKKAFIYKRAFNKHIQSHAGLKVEDCTVCEQVQDCSCGKLKNDIKPTLQCEVCGVYLKSLYALKFHIAAIHKNDRPFQCAVCEKRFVLKTKLTTHMKYKHAEGGRLFYCDQCNYRAFDARGLKVHQMCVHSKERPFPCPHCPSAFAIKFYLDVHLRKHTGEKPFRCSECSQTFAQRPSLTRHRRTHHGLEPVNGRKKSETNIPA